VVRELSVAERRYLAVLSVIEDGLSVTEAAAKVGVSRQTPHAWLGRYAGSGLDGLADRSRRPRSCLWFPPNRGGFLYAASRVGAAVFS